MGTFAEEVFVEAENFAQSRQIACSDIVDFFTGMLAESMSAYLIAHLKRKMITH